jgi:uncharacterized protein (TIGR00251 family)
MSAELPFLRNHPGGISLDLKVVPRASRTELGGVVGNRLKVRIAAPPVDSSANEELIAFLARRFGVSRGVVSLARGAASRNKTVRVLGVDLERAEMVLGQNC